MPDVDQLIDTLLRQLTDPDLPQYQVEAIQERVEYLQSLQE